MGSINLTMDHIFLEVLDKSPGYRSRKEVTLDYSWERLFVEEIGPLFLGTTKPDTSTGDSE